MFKDVMVELTDEYKKLYKNSIPNEELYIQFLKYKIGFIENKLKNEMSKKPYKIFKNKYLNWKNKVNELENELFNLYNIFSEYKN